MPIGSFIYIIYIVENCLGLYERMITPLLGKILLLTRRDLAPGVIFCIRAKYFFFLRKWDSNIFNKNMFMEKKLKQNKKNVKNITYSGDFLRKCYTYLLNSQSHRSHHDNLCFHYRANLLRYMSPHNHKDTYQSDTSHLNMKISKHPRLFRVSHIILEHEHAQKGKIFSGKIRGTNRAAF